MRSVYSPRRRKQDVRRSGDEAVGDGGGYFGLITSHIQDAQTTPNCLVGMQYGSKHRAARSSRSKPSSRSRDSERRRRRSVARRARVSRPVGSATSCSSFFFRTGRGLGHQILNKTLSFPHTSGRALPRHASLLDASPVFVLNTVE